MYEVVSRAKEIEGAMALSEARKAWFHGALAAFALVETFTCKSRTRRLLVWSCFGWHIFAVYEHLRDINGA